MITRGRYLSPGSVKICGNRDPQLCRVAVEAGADYLGFIFVPGAKRQTSLEVVTECIAAARRGTARQVSMVGVFVDEQSQVINRIAKSAGLDVVQLHGSESPQSLTELDLPAIKVLRPRPEDSFDQIRRLAESYLNANNAPEALLIDGFDSTQLGGAGIKTDWEIAGELARLYPIVLAGGLTSENVGSAVELVRPLGVDVSSGVETAGTRDAKKIKHFVEEAKSAFAAFPNPN